MKWKKNVKKKIKHNTTLEILMENLIFWPCCFFVFWPLIKIKKSTKSSFTFKNSSDPSRHIQTLKVLEGTNDEGIFFRWQKKTHPEQWTNPTICCQLCCLEFLFWVSTSRAPCRKNNFEGWKICQVLVVSQLLTKCTSVEFSQTCLRPLFLLPPHFEEKNKWASNLFCKTQKSLSGASFCPGV